VTCAIVFQLCQVQIVEVSFVQYFKNSYHKRLYLKLPNAIGWLEALHQPSQEHKYTFLSPGKKDNILGIMRENLANKIYFTF